MNITTNLDLTRYLAGTLKQLYQQGVLTRSELVKEFVKRGCDEEVAHGVCDTLDLKSNDSKLDPTRMATQQDRRTA